MAIPLTVAVLVAADALLILSAISGAAFLRFGAVLWDRVDDGFGVRPLVLTGVIQVCLLCARLYDPRRFADRKELFRRTLNALASAALIMAALYFVYPSLMIGRGVFIIASVLILACVVVLRVAFNAAFLSYGTAVGSAAKQ